MEENTKPVFDPSKSKAISTLMAMSHEEIFNRYCKTLTPNQENFFARMTKVLNTEDGDGYLVYADICSTNGYNLNHLTTIINLESAKLKKFNYEFKLDRLVKDLDLILSEYPEDVSRIKDNPNMESPFMVQFARFFDREVFENVILAKLNKSKNIGFDN